MALNIRNTKTEDLAATVAQITGETKTEAVTIALQERLTRLERQSKSRRLVDELNEIALHCAALPIYDDRSANEIIGYDERGLQRNGG
ncbi:MAG: type II toxin-antitoxin system VapB family antitoxin [Gammaproteobacteria bacterium]|nr:type II toxin-antitoxin system VapB family antitoxin [Gammaproteobacteria bacterium]